MTLISLFVGKKIKTQKENTMQRSLWVEVEGAEVINLGVLRVWCLAKWDVDARLRLTSTGGNKVMVEFQTIGESKRILKWGLRNFYGGSLRMGRWNPEYGCCRDSFKLEERWVRVFGLHFRFGSYRLRNR